MREIYPLYVPLKVSSRQRLDHYARLDRRRSQDHAALLLEWAIDNPPAQFPRSTAPSPEQQPAA